MATEAAKTSTGQSMRLPSQNSHIERKSTPRRHPYQMENLSADQNDQFIDCFHKRHVAYLQNLLQQSMKTSNGMINQLRTENEHQREVVNNFRTANAAFEHSLHEEKTAHIYTKQLLMEEKRVSFETILQQQNDIRKSQTDHVATYQELELEKKQLADMAAELDCTQRKFHLVDSLVDVMLLQEDSELDMPDRSRQVTDVIIDLEARMDNMYKSLLQGKDKQIAELEHILKEHSD